MKYLLSILTLLLCSFAMHADEVKHFDFHYPLEDFEFERMDSVIKVYEKDILGAHCDHESGPVMCHMCYPVVLPENARIKSVSWTTSDKILVAEDVVIGMDLPWLSSLGTPPPSGWEVYEGFDGYYPKTKVTYWDTLAPRAPKYGVKRAALYVCPFEYDPTTKKLYLTENVSVDLIVEAMDFLSDINNE